VGCKAYYIASHSKDCGDRKNLEYESMRPEIIDDNEFMWGMDRADQMCTIAHAAENT
jgi:hypothetical protein